MVFVSGQASVDAAEKIVVDSFEGEVRRSLENMAKVLKAAGCGFDHVRKPTELGSRARRTLWAQLVRLSGMVLAIWLII